MLVIIPSALEFRILKLGEKKREKEYVDAFGIFSW